MPDAIKADGKIKVGTDSTYAPAEFLDADGKTVIGFDVDLFNAVAQKLGLKTEFVSAHVRRRSSPASTPASTRSASRRSRSTPSASSRSTWSATSGRHPVGDQDGQPAEVDTDNACGKKIAVQTGTVQVDDITARSKKCTDAGKPAITIDQYQAQADATAAVVSGKDDAMLADSPVGAYAVKQTNGQLELLGEIYDVGPVRLRASSKDQTDFAKAIQEAVKALIADGSYQTVLEKWGVEGGAITDPAVNP